MNEAISKYQIFGDIIKGGADIEPEEALNMLHERIEKEEREHNKGRLLFNKLKMSKQLNIAAFVVSLASLVLYLYSLFTGSENEIQPLPFFILFVFSATVYFYTKKIIKRFSKNALLKYLKVIEKKENCQIKNDKKEFRMLTSVWEFYSPFLLIFAVVCVQLFYIPKDIADLAQEYKNKPEAVKEIRAAEKNKTLSLENNTNENISIIAYFEWKRDFLKKYGNEKEIQNIIALIYGIYLALFLFLAWVAYYLYYYFYNARRH